MKKLIIRLIEWLCGFVDYTALPFKEAMKKEDTIVQLVLGRDEALHQIEVLEARIDGMRLTTMEDLQKENGELKAKIKKTREDIVKANEFYEKVQTELSSVMHNDPIYGFKSSMCFPGATAAAPILTKDDLGNKYIEVAGRTCMFDENTAELKTYASMEDKYKYCIGFLTRYDTLGNIVKMLIARGALSVGIGYNSDNTTAEIYYNIKCIAPTTDITINYDDRNYTTG